MHSWHNIWKVVGKFSLALQLLRNPNGIEEEERKGVRGRGRSRGESRDPKERREQCELGDNLREAGINMKGEVSISNWYLGDPKQTQLERQLVAGFAPSSSSYNLVTRVHTYKRSRATLGISARFNRGK